MALWIRSFVVFAAILLALQSAHARDRDGRYANSPLHGWFEHLANKMGRCFSDADGRALSDVDWESHDGHYRAKSCGADDGLAYLVRRAPSNSMLHAREHDLEISMVARNHQAGRLGLSIQSNSDAELQASLISSDYAEMESSIAFSIGIGLNRSLRSRLRGLAGASESQAIFVSHFQTGAWLEIHPNGSVISRRQKPEGLPSIDLEQAVMRDPALGELVDAALKETRALRRARKLMEHLVRGWGLPSPQQFGRLIEWSPMLEHLAYRCATRMSSLVDTIRYDILESRVNEARLAQYWMAIHTMANRAASGAQRSPFRRTHL